jgi:hypothetical protein
MEEALRPQCGEGERFAILDVRNGNFITSCEHNRQLGPLLRSEAVAFMSMWENLNAAPEAEEEEEFDVLPIRRTPEEELRPANAEAQRIAELRREEQT